MATSHHIYTTLAPPLHTAFSHLHYLITTLYNPTSLHHASITTPPCLFTPAGRQHSHSFSRRHQTCHANTSPRANISISPPVPSHTFSFIFYHHITTSALVLHTTALPHLGLRVLTLLQCITTLPHLLPAFIKFSPTHSHTATPPAIPFIPHYNSPPPYLTAFPIVQSPTL